MVHCRPHKHSMTTQNALLERFLAHQRIRKVKNYTYGRRVIDFGCGLQAWASSELQQYCETIIGVEPASDTTFINGVQIVNSLTELPRHDYELVIALAVFEHLHPKELQAVLTEMASITTPNACIVGTVPTPSSRWILELLSFKLKIIDPSQIRDHKVYYDDLWLKAILADTPWRILDYKTFQLRLNSFFVLGKK